MRATKTKILIVGGGLGGVAAAIGAMRVGADVILTEETDWLGGQLTAQAVPPDENPYIEQTGATFTYRLLRQKIREYYKRNYPLLPQYQQSLNFNPGKGDVSPLCHEPHVAVAVIDELLAPFRASGQLDLRKHYQPIRAEVDGDTIRAVTFKHVLSGDDLTITADYVVDATELGDLLELADVEHVIGAESQTDTGELHAPDTANPLDQQAFSWCFALGWHEDQEFVIAKPDGYDFWQTAVSHFWTGSQLSWDDIDPMTLTPRHHPIFGKEYDSPPPLRTPSRWLYRRIFYKDYYPEGKYSTEISLVNWPQIDYWQGTLVGVDDATHQQHIDGAKSLSLSFLYWMQTEAPRFDGKQGYPGLRLRGDLMETEHGLAKTPYIRESRRIQAEFTVLEQHIGLEQRGDLIGAERFDDSVGIGSYRIDLHPSKFRTYVDIPTWPFQIPLGTLIPVRMENLLPANKNIGSTHITNGAYRLHPIEWNIGEVAGSLIVYCMEHGYTPRQVRNTPNLLTDFQNLLVKMGVVLEWPEFARQVPRDLPQLKWVIPERNHPYSDTNRP